MFLKCCFTPYTSLDENPCKEEIAWHFLLLDFVNIYVIAHKKHLPTCELYDAETSFVAMMALQIASEK